MQEQYKSFSRIHRQYVYSKSVLRSGWAHSPHGISAIPQGGLAVSCWACPHDGINLPSNWKDAPADSRYEFYSKIVIELNVPNLQISLYAHCCR